MTQTRQMLQSFCDRLGITDSATIQNAEHYLKNIQNKSSKTVIVSDSAKAIICLDLAAANVGSKFDKDSAIKLAGLKKGAYQTKLNLLEKLLELDKPLTVSDLCVRLGCTVVKETAEEILNRYQETIDIRDYNYPQYAVAAIFAACKAMKIKIDKSQCVSLSRLKPLKWKEIENEFTVFAENLGLFGDDVKPRKMQLVSQEEEMAKMEQEIARNRIKEEKLELEDYEVWKERIVRESLAEIEKQKRGKF